MRTMSGVVLISVCFVFGVASMGCGQNAPGTACQPGQEGCECINGECEDGLFCASGQCVLSTDEPIFTTDSQVYSDTATATDTNLSDTVPTHSTDSGSELDGMTDSETETEVETSIDTGTVSEIETDTDTDTETETETETETDTGTETDSEAHPVDECVQGLDNCQQVCIDLVDGFECGCHLGFDLQSDAHSCVEIDDCVSNPCLNGGICSDDTNGFSCGCVDGWVGDLCDIAPSHCDTDDDCDDWCMDGKCVERTHYQWGTSGTDECRALALGGNSMLALVGYTTGDLFDEVSGTADFFVIGFHTEVGIQYGTQWGTQGLDMGYDVAFDSNNDIYITGYTEGVYPGNTSLAMKDMVVSMVDANGDLVWFNQYAGQSGQYASGHGIAVGPNDEIWAVGSADKNMGGVTWGERDIVLVETDKATRQYTAYNYGSASWEDGIDIVVDSSGSIYVSGYTNGSMEGSRDGDTDMVVMKIQPNGQEEWIDQRGTYKTEWAAQMALSSDEAYLYVAGTSDGNMYDGNKGDRDVLLAKYNTSTGVREWIRQWGSTGEERAYVVAVMVNGNILVSGYTRGTMTAPSSGAADIFLTEYTSDGTHLWTRQWGSSKDDFGQGLAVDSNGTIYIAGATWGNIGKPNAGDRDIYLTVIK